jgi:N-methylhydantoinase B
VSTEVVLTVHGAPTGRLAGGLHGSGLEPAQSHGLFGGLPGCNTYFELRTDAGVRRALSEGLPLELEALGGEVHRLPPQGLFELDEGTVFLCRSDGGGGLGDPLLRAPERVAADVAAGLVSAEQAERVYGVVLVADGSGVDVSATAALRHRLRVARLGREPARSVDGAPAGSGRAAGRELAPGHGQLVRCAGCGWEPAVGDGDWKTAAVEHTQPLAALGAVMASTLFALRGFVCPACGTLLDAEMTLPADAPVRTYSPLGR